MSKVKNKRLGHVPVSRSFHERLLSFNNLGSLGFKEWIFQPAMLFSSLDKWWGDLGKRPKPHEGVDLYYYQIEKGNLEHLTAEMKIPVIFAGEVVKVIDDFLGKSVFVTHDAYSSNGQQLYTIYGHIKPGNHIRPGARLSQGDIIGIIADAENSGMFVPPHLHISVAWISNTVHAQELGWEMTNNPAKVVLLDPLSVIECPHSIVPSL